MNCVPNPSREKRPRRIALALVAVTALFLGNASEARALDIQFDYSFDTNNFFVGHLDRQLVLEAAARVFEAHIFDGLTGIVPSENNRWKEVFPHPSTGALIKVKNDIIAPNELRVYVGARPLGGGKLGVGGPGGFSAKGELTFLRKVATRGQSGATAKRPTDFGPWGGALTFDLNADWYFDLEVITMEDIGSQHDFYSIAIHELGHLLGLGTAPSWWTDVGRRGFKGTASILTNNGDRVPLAGDARHWSEGIQSSVAGPPFGLQEVAMDPTLFSGSRKTFTELDYAGLADIGWMVAPEPGTALLTTVGATFLLGRRVRSKRLP